jgi:hypothetical protein
MSNFFRIFAEIKYIIMSSPKEKAKELIEKFKLNVLDYEGNGINEYKAKQCVLIAQQNLLDKLKSLNIKDEYEENVLSEINEL